MTHKNENQTSAWLDYSNSSQKNKTFFAQNKQGNELELDTFITGFLSPDFAAQLQSVWEIGVEAYLPVEMDFLRTFPEVVQHEPYYKNFEPLFAQGADAVEWASVEQEMKKQLKQHFVFNPTSLSDQIKKMFADDIVIFINLKDKVTKQVLGFAVFSIRPGFAFGAIKVSHLAIAPFAQKRGLATLLLSSIFKIVPKVKNIVLCTRITNETAQQAYAAWGFERDLNPKQDPHYTFNLDHWIFMNYDVNKADILQKKSLFIK